MLQIGKKLIGYETRAYLVLSDMLKVKILFPRQVLVYTNTLWVLKLDRL